MTDFFPILRLPPIVLNEVIKEYNPIELYQFTKTSRKAKEIVKSIEKRVAELDFSFSNDPELNLKFAGEERDWTFQMDHMTRLPFEVRENHQSLTLFSENPAEDFLILVEEILEIFECSEIQRVYFGPWSKRRIVESFVPWLNKTKLEIQNIHLSFRREQLYKFFWTHYKKPIKGLESQFGGRIDIPLTLKFEYLHAAWGGQYLSLDQLYPLNCKEIDMVTLETSSEEVNLFLKSWKEGKSNTGLKRICFYNFKEMDWNVILKGLEPELRDLTTTKRKYESIIIHIAYPRIGCWYHGGFDIQRDDGTIATIFHLYFKTTEENAEIPQATIDYFNKYRDKDWNSGEVEIEELTIAEEEARRAGLLMPRGNFEMIVFE